MDMASAGAIPVAMVCETEGRTAGDWTLPGRPEKASLQDELSKRVWLMDFPAHGSVSNLMLSVSGFPSHYSIMA